MNRQRTKDIKNIMICNILHWLSLSQMFQCIWSVSVYNRLDRLKHIELLQNGTSRPGTRGRECVSLNVFGLKGRKKQIIPTMGH